MTSLARIHAADIGASARRGDGSARSRGGRFILAAGGTGGHVYPAIAIADALRKRDRDAEILFVGTRDRMEWTAVPKAGYRIRPVWISGFDRSMRLGNLLFPVKLIVSLAQSLAIVMGFRPDAIIACGGFASGPVGWVGARMGVPLYLQEQNRTPGVTTRLLMKDAAAIFVTFPIEGIAKAERVSSDRSGAKAGGVEVSRARGGSDRVRVYGNPTREAIIASVERPSTPGERVAWLASMGLADDPSKPIVLVMGGSGGAMRINEAVWSNLDRLTADAPDGLGLQIIWQCGARYHDAYARRMEARRSERATGGSDGVALVPFIDQVSLAYQAASLVITRSGAGSLSELMIAGKAMILIPSPHVAGDHQTHNARWMEAEGAARVLTDAEAVESLVEQVRELMAHPDERSRLAERAAALASRDAADRIVTDILDDLGDLVRLTPGIHTN